MVSPPRLIDALPTVARALQASLLREGELQLAAQIDHALIYTLCWCDDPECMTFSVLAPADNLPGEYRVVLPDAVLTIGVRNERLGRIEDNTMGRTDADTLARQAEYQALIGLVPRELAEG